MFLAEGSQTWKRKSFPALAFGGKRKSFVTARARNADIDFSPGASPEPEDDSPFLVVAGQMLEQLLTHDLKQLLRQDLDAAATEELQFAETGRVTRHIWRGEAPHDAKETKVAEDAASWCGMRDPSALHDSWPSLWEAMALISPVLLRARQQHSQPRTLHRTFGDKAAQEPPAAELVATVRREVGKALGLAADATEERHKHSSWRHRLVRAIQQLSRDRTSRFRNGWPMAHPWA